MVVALLHSLRGGGADSSGSLVGVAPVSTAALERAFAKAPRCRNAEELLSA